MTGENIMACNREDGDIYAGHDWTYGVGRLSAEPYRECRNCSRVEVYYLDDLELEREMGV
jgi:hypothetical protein